LNGDSAPTSLDTGPPVFKGIISKLDDDADAIVDQGRLDLEREAALLMKWHA
jgi:hypothetical protein